MTVKYIHYRPGQWFITQAQWDRDLGHLEAHIAKYGAEDQPGYWELRLAEYKKTKPGLYGTPDGRGGHTIAYEVVENNDGSPDKLVYAVASCSCRDNYNKAIGRAIAKGRLYSALDKRVVIGFDPNGGSVPEQILRDIVWRTVPEKYRANPLEVEPTTIPGM